MRREKADGSRSTVGKQRGSLLWIQDMKINFQSPPAKRRSKLSIHVNSALRRHTETVSEPDIYSVTFSTKKLPSMNLVLIRHGETVDNVAQIYAGVKDSALTNHGILQAERLGQHFAQSGFEFTKIFSSNLQRAYKTAEAIRLAQHQADDKLKVIQSPLLQERDFGWYEGKPFHARQRSPKSSSSRVGSSEQPKPSDFKDVESRESLIRRMGIFIQDELLPLLQWEVSEVKSVVCVVSHGIILSYLWKTLLKLFPLQNVALAPDLLVGNRAFMPLEPLGGWSNTGYLRLEISQEYAADANARKNSTRSTATSNLKPTSQDSSFPLLAFRMTILAINSKDHLNGLKRTRGGVGSSRHDEGQKKIEAFFKKPKVE